MARRTTSMQPERPDHSVEEKRQDIIRLQRRIKELEDFDPSAVTSRFSDPAVTGLQTAIASTLASVFGQGTMEYNRYSSAARLDQGPISMSSSWIEARGGGYRDEGAEARQYLIEGKAKALVLLRQAVQALEEEIEFALPRLHESVPMPVGARLPSRKVFVVHGHDDAAKQGLARFLEKIELEAVILHEQPDQGRTVIEKFEEYAAQVGFAVVLLTPDDLGAAKTDVSQNARARQNVVFELGYFAGRLGRGRTCLLRKGDVEMPSDLYGVIYTDLDPGEGWKVKLVKEMKAAGLAFDANKLWE